MAYLIVNEHHNYETTSVWTTIDKYIKEERLEELLIIVPTGKLSRYYATEIINRYKAKHNRAVGGLNIFSFMKLVDLIAKSVLTTGGKAKLVSSAYALALFEEAVNDIKQKFEYFSKSGLSSSLLKRLFGVITGLRASGIDSYAMENDINQWDDSSESKSNLSKMQDMHKIMLAYENILTNVYIDPSGVLKSINKHIDERSFSLVDLFPSCKLVLLDQFSEFRKPEVDFLQKLGKKPLPMAIHFDYSADEGPLLGGYEATIMDLATDSFRIIPIGTKYEEKKDLGIASNRRAYSYAIDNAAAQLRKKLFQKSKETDAKYNYLDNSIKIISTKSRLDEVRFIGKLVKHLNINEGIALKDIAICFRSSDEYPGLFREVFHSYNIPSNVTDRFLLNSSPLVTGIFALFDIINNKYKATDIRRAFSVRYFSKQVKRADGSVDEISIDVDKIVDVLGMLRLSSGYGRLSEEKLNSRIEEAITRRETSKEVLVSGGDEDDKLEIYRLENDIRNIKYVKDKMELIERLLQFGKDEGIKLKDSTKLSPEEYVKWIENLIIYVFDVPSKLIDKFDDLITKFPHQMTTENIIQSENIERESQALHKFFQLAREFAEITSDRHPGEKFTFRELTDGLRTAVEGERFQVREKKNYGVTITSIEQLRGIPYKVTILCGAVDGEFPLKYRPEVFFMSKEQIDAAKKNSSEDKNTNRNYQYTSEIKHIISERTTFYQFLMNNVEAYGKEKQVFITYPENKDEQQLLPSHFIDYLLNITNLRERGNVFSLRNPSEDNEEQKFYAKLSEMPASILELSEKWNPSMGIDIVNKSIQAKLEAAFVFSNNYNLATQKDYNKSIMDILLDEVPSEAREHLQAYNDKVYSASELEKYGKCGFQYFIENILGVSLPGEYSDELSPLELGNLVHKVLYRFYKDMGVLEKSKVDIPEGLEPVGIATEIAQSKNELDKNIKIIDIKRYNYPEWKQFYLRELMRIAISEKQRQYGDKISPILQLSFDKLFGTEQYKGILEKWLEAELNKYDFPIGKNVKFWDFLPGLFELDFAVEQEASNGKKQRYLELSGSEDKLKVRGKIDRLEFKEVPNDTNKCIDFLVADYKSNVVNQPNRKQLVECGGDEPREYYQIPLYLAAAEKYLNEYYKSDGEEVTFTPIAGVYYAYDKITSKYATMPKGTLISVSEENQSLSVDGTHGNITNIRELIEHSIDDAIKAKKQISEGIIDNGSNVEKSYFLNNKKMNILYKGFGMQISSDPNDDESEGNSSNNE